MMKIPITRPYFTGDEQDRIGEVLAGGWVTQGPAVARFEQDFARFTGSRHALAVTSCTAALHLALLALDIGEGDEVLVPAFTFTASANVVEIVHARAVLCDVDPDTYNLDPGRIEECISHRTKAIMPVHLFGLPADMEPILDLAGKHHIAVIEDAACGFGAHYRGSHVGNLGDLGCFSFHPRKAVTTGEGGMVTTENGSLAERIRSLRDHGVMISDLERHSGGRPYTLPDVREPGLNYRMTDIQAALGITQMEKAETIQSARLKWARRYDEALAGVPWLRTPVCPDGSIHGYQSYVCLFEPERITAENLERTHARRNAFMDHLQSRGIASRPGTQAVHTLRYYRERYNLEPRDFPNALTANLCTVALPLYAGLTDDEFGHVIDTIKGYDPACAA